MPRGTPTTTYGQLTQSPYGGGPAPGRGNISPFMPATVSTPTPGRGNIFPFMDPTVTTPVPGRPTQTGFDPASQAPPTGIEVEPQAAMPDPVQQMMDRLRQSQRRGSRQQYSDLRNLIQKSIHRRGIQRSGFAGKLMTKLGGQEATSIAAIEAGLIDPSIAAREALANQVAANQAAHEAKKDSGGGWLAPALGLAGAIGGTFLAPGVGTLAGYQVGSSIGGAF